MGSVSRLWTILVGVGLAVLVSSCTNSGRHYLKEGANERLETEILPDGSKMFMYRIGHLAPPNAAKEGRKVADIATAERYRRGARPERISEDKLRANAEHVVGAVGYCRDGFFMLDRNLTHHNLWVKGECRESATEADMHAFGAKQILDAQAWNKSSR